MRIRGDCHVHLKDEGKFRNGDIERLIDCAYREKGYNFIIVTDHHNVLSSLEVRDYVVALKIPFVVITGTEVDTTEGQICCWNIFEDVPPGMSIKDTSYWVRARGGMVIKVHPEDPERIKANLPYLDGFEEENGRHGWFSLDGVKLFRARGSDAHGYLEFKHANQFVELDVDSLSPQAIVESIRRAKS
jgi:predicted metal-dependent phosphoesterase TrpH